MQPALDRKSDEQRFEKGENLPCILNKKYGKENYIIEDFYNFLIESNNEGKKSYFFFSLGYFGCF